MQITLNAFTDYILAKSKMAIVNSQTCQRLGSRIPIFSDDPNANKSEPV